MSERGIAAEGPQERFLERVLGVGPPEKPGQVAEHLVAVLFVEALEGGQGHGVHHAV